MKDSTAIPSAFIWKRLHSLSGLFLALYLFEHLLINSQAALLFGDDGSGFVEAVNAIHQLPYLPVIEIGLLGFPILLHGILGVQYLFTGVSNSGKSDGTTPSLPYGRNKAYTWQRITSWILLFGIVFHVIHMRIVEYPTAAKEGNKHFYLVRLDADTGLASVADRLDVKLYTQAQIPKKSPWSAALEGNPLGSGEVMAVAPTFGMAELLMVRETFKMPVMMAIYTVFVLAACFHGFNGLWTFMISWGINLTPRSQRRMLGFCIFLMCLVAFFGLATIWGTYWINLKQ